MADRLGPAALAAAILAVALSSPSPIRSDELGSADAPWFNMTGCRHPSRTLARSSGYHDPDNRGSIICDLRISICGDVIERSKTINGKTEHCPPSLHYKNVPSRPVCCERWESSKSPDSRCNGSVDADCDGVPNSEDDTPISANGRS